MGRESLLISVTRVCPSVPRVAHTLTGPAGARTGNSCGTGRERLGEHQHPVVVGTDERLPARAGPPEREQLVRGTGQGVDVDAVDADARQVEQRVEHPQRGGERVADAGPPEAVGQRGRVQLVDAELEPVGVRQRRRTGASA